MESTVPSPIGESLDDEEGTRPEAPEAPVKDGTPERAGTRLRVRRFLLVIGLVALDLWSKAAVFRWLGSEGSAILVEDVHDHERVPILGEWFAFMLSWNPGAAFGRLSGYPHLLVGGRVLAGLFLTVLLWRSPRGRPWSTAALVLILAGALGNLHDNLLMPAPLGHPFGEVRDFIDVYFAKWDWHFPTFNVADSCITVGAVLLILSGFIEDGGAQPASTREAPGR